MKTIKIEDVVEDFICGFDQICQDYGFKTNLGMKKNICNLEVMKRCLQLKTFKTHISSYVRAIREKELISTFTEEDYKILESLALEMYK